MDLQSGEFLLRKLSDREKRDYFLRTDIIFTTIMDICFLYSLKIEHVNHLEAVFRVTRRDKRLAHFQMKINKSRNHYVV